MKIDLEEVEQKIVLELEEERIDLDFAGLKTVLEEDRLRIVPVEVVGLRTDLEEVGWRVDPEVARRSLRLVG